MFILQIISLKSKGKRGATDLSMGRKSRFSHGTNKTLLAFNAHNRLGCFVSLELTSCRFLVVFCIAVTSHSRFSGITATHLDRKYGRNENQAESEEEK